MTEISRRYGACRTGCLPMKARNEGGQVGCAGGSGGAPPPNPALPVLENSTELSTRRQQLGKSLAEAEPKVTTFFFWSSAGFCKHVRRRRRHFASNFVVVVVILQAFSSSSSSSSSFCRDFAGRYATSLRESRYAASSFPASFSRTFRKKQGIFVTWDGDRCGRLRESESVQYVGSYINAFHRCSDERELSLSHTRAPTHTASTSRHLTKESTSRRREK